MSGHGYIVNFLLKTNTERDIPEVLARPEIAVNNSLHTRTDASLLLLELLEGRGEPCHSWDSGTAHCQSKRKHLPLVCSESLGVLVGMCQPPASMACAGWLWVFCLARAVPSCCLLWSF